MWLLKINWLLYYIIIIIFIIIIIIIIFLLLLSLFNIEGRSCTQSERFFTYTWQLHDCARLTPKIRIFLAKSLPNDFTSPFPDHNEYAK